MRWKVVLGLFVLFGFEQGALCDEPEPRAVPCAVRIERAAGRQIVFDSLPEDRQVFLAHLRNAANAAEPVLFFQSHRHALSIRSLIFRSLSEKHIAETKKILGEAFQEYLVYSALFLQQRGPYHFGNRKIILKKVYFTAMMPSIYQLLNSLLNPCNMTRIIIKLKHGWAKLTIRPGIWKTLWRNGRKWLTRAELTIFL